MLDLYCERTAPGFWAEPVNAASNIAFLVAAWLVWRIALRNRVMDRNIAAMIAVIVAIGIGSFLFHTLATTFARRLDDVPVFVFQLFYIGLYARCVMRLTPAVVVTVLVTFVGAVFVTLQFPDRLNASLVYAPALLVTLVLGLHYYLTRSRERGLLLVAALIFAFAILLRAADMAVCKVFAPGSHFLWHLLAALAIYLAMRALILCFSARRSGLC